jgi:hypothetical protein
MKWIIRIYTFVLLIYTGWRTIDFLLMQLPATDTSWWLAIVFLFSTEIGILIWHEISLSHTTTYTQHYIATGLTWLDFTGSFGAGVADMILRQTMMVDYKIPPALAMGLIIGLPLIVAINVAGALVYLANDADLQRMRTRKFLEFEADQQAMAEINAGRRKLVARRKQALMKELTTDYEDVPLMVQVEPKLMAPPSNGHNKEEPIEINPTQRRRLKS